MRAAREPPLRPPLTAPQSIAPTIPEHIWIEAEQFSPLNGYNFSFTRDDQTPPDTWSLAGPGVADAWTQGGESEFLSVAARSDAAAGIAISKTVEIPSAGEYTLWVRYADYREKQELFGIRITRAER